jgi:hypothetical protein
VARLKPLKERAPVAIVRFMPISDSTAQGEGSCLFGSRQKRLGEQAGCCPSGHRADLPRRVAARFLPVCQGLATPSQSDVMR